MVKKTDRGGKARQANSQQESKNEVWYMPIVDFFFDSVYDIVTWVAIASCIGLAVYFLSQKNWRGLMWSLTFLLCSVLIMIAIRADQRFFRFTTNTKAESTDSSVAERRPHVFFTLTMLKKPLAIGEKAVVQFVLRNNGTRDARVKFWDNTYYFNVKPFKNSFAYQPYAPTSADIAAGQDINGELRFDFIATKDELAALESGDARLLFYARGEYRGDDDKIYPLPFCRMWDKDFNGNLILCPDALKLAKNTDHADKKERPTDTVPDALAKSAPAPTAKPIGYGSGAPPARMQRPFFADLTAPKWTDYKEDYFYGAIWQWEWRPEMGDKIARNITALCPECDRPLNYHKDPTIEKDGSRMFRVYCGKHVGKTYFVHSPNHDPRDGIQKLISENLDSGEWREVVKRQRDARRGW